MLRLRFSIPFAAACLLAVSLFPSCTNQGEGDRCSTLNGNDDCQDGLVCTPGSALNPPQNTDICCPSDRSQATTTVCSIGAGDGGQAPLPDAGGSDVGSDTATDAPSATDAADAGDAGMTSGDASDGASSADADAGTAMMMDAGDAAEAGD